MTIIDIVISGPLAINENNKHLKKNIYTWLCTPLGFQVSLLALTSWYINICDTRRKQNQKKKTSNMISMCLIQETEVKMKYDEREGFRYLSLFLQ